MDESSQSSVPDSRNIVNPMEQPEVAENILDSNTKPLKNSEIILRRRSIHKDKNEYFVSTQRSNDKQAAESPRVPDFIITAFQEAVVEDFSRNLQTDEISEDNSDSIEESSPNRKLPKSASRSPSAQPEVVAESRNKNTKRVNYCIAILLCAVAFMIYGLRRANKPTEVAQQHCDQFVNLRSKYPTTDRMLWNTLNVSVNRAAYQDPGEPATFIFLYNSIATGESLLDEVTHITSECFGGRAPIHLGSSYFQSTEIVQDSEVFLKQYLQKLLVQGIMVVHDLDQIPPRAAKAFFPICDSYEPLVHKAVIFFTMNISHQPEQVVNSDRSPTEIAENILKGLWKQELPANFLDPLVVRLTENVFRVG